MTHKLTQLVRRSIVFAAVVAAVAGAAFAGEAKAVAARQAVKSVVATVYWDLDSYWIPSRKAGVRYYNYFSGGRLVDYSTACGSTSKSHGTEGFYCPSSETIYLDSRQQARNLRRFGDGAVAFWTAHEYGHHVEKLLGINWTRYAPYHELLADCFAGMEFHHGVYTSGKLAYHDYLEARNQLWALSDSDADHGTRTRRLAAFDFGFRQENNRNVCINGAGRSY